MIPYHYNSHFIKWHNTVDHAFIDSEAREALLESTDVPAKYAGCISMECKLSEQRGHRIVQLAMARAKSDKEQERIDALDHDITKDLSHPWSNAFR